MKIITVKDCHELKDKFTNYCETAEQHQFPLLAVVNIRLDATIAKIDGDGEVKNQKDARAMFRVILKMIGEDFSAYEENVDNRLQEVKNVMTSLGYPKTDLIELDPIDDIRCKVIYSGHLTIGIYDFDRHTFVD